MILLWIVLNNADVTSKEGQSGVGYLIKFPDALEFGNQVEYLRKIYTMN